MVRFWAGLGAGGWINFELVRREHLKTCVSSILMAACFSAVPSSGQSVLFDFENAPLHSSLPITLAAGGVSAQFAASDQGFSVQPANTMGFTPAGFSGNCLYPNSVFASDLFITFTPPVTGLSLLYAPQELACDSSARMRVTAYMGSSLVGTTTTNASPPGTWPSATLAFTGARPFNYVIVHYDAPPPTGGDWGPIFMADNLMVSPVSSTSFSLQGAMLPNGVFQVSFTNRPGASPSVLGTTNAALPLPNWTALGTASEIAPGQFQFTHTAATNRPAFFYRVLSP